MLTHSTDDRSGIGQTQPARTTAWADWYRQSRFIQRRHL